MANSATVKLEGSEELMKRLKEGDVKIRKRLKPAAQAGGKVLQDAAISRAPGPEIVVVPEKTGTNTVELAIGPSREKWYYRYFETGAREHEVKPVKARALLIEGEYYASAKATGGVTAQPFMRPALDSQLDEVIRAVGEVLWQALKEASR